MATSASKRRCAARVGLHDRSRKRLFATCILGHTAVSGKMPLLTSGVITDARMRLTFRNCGWQLCGQLADVACGGLFGWLSGRTTSREISSAAGPSVGRGQRAGPARQRRGPIRTGCDTPRGSGWPPVPGPAGARGQWRPRIRNVPAMRWSRPRVVWPRPAAPD